MRTWLVVCGLVAAASAASTRADAQQEPAPAELPAAYRGGEIGQAIASRNWGRAEELLVGAIERETSPKPLLEVLGRVFLIDRKPLNAAIAFRKAEAIASLQDRSRFALALAYISLRHGDWARPELDRLSSTDPANPIYEYWQGRLDYDDGQYASAVTHFEHVIAQDPSFVRAYDNLGLSLEALNEPDRALPRYRQAVTLNRTAKVPSPWPCLNLAILLRTHGDVKEAESLLREALGYDGTFAQAHYQLGMLLERDNRVDEAIAELTRASDDDAAYPEPHYALMRIYRRLGRIGEADQALATFQRLHDARREGPR